MFKNVMAVDRDSIRVVAAFRLVEELEAEEIRNIPIDDRHYDQKRKAIEGKYRRKNIALLRNTAGHFLQIVEETK